MWARRDSEDIKGSYAISRGLDENMFTDELTLGDSHRIFERPCPKRSRVFLHIILVCALAGSYGVEGHDLAVC